MLTWAETQRRHISLGLCCSACGNTELGPLLQNDLWNDIGFNLRFLCEGCMEKRLSRPLRMPDLRNTPWNRSRNIALGKRYPVM